MMHWLSKAENLSSGAMLAFDCGFLSAPPLVERRRLSRLPVASELLKKQSLVIYAPL